MYHQNTDQRYCISLGVRFGDFLNGISVGFKLLHLIMQWTDNLMLILKHKGINMVNWENTFVVLILFTFLNYPKNFGCLSHLLSRLDMAIKVNVVKICPHKKLLGNTSSLNTQWKRNTHIHMYIGFCVVLPYVKEWGNFVSFHTEGNFSQGGWGDYVRDSFDWPVSEVRTVTSG